MTEEVIRPTDAIGEHHAEGARAATAAIILASLEQGVEDGFGDLPDGCKVGRHAQYLLKAQDYGPSDGALALLLRECSLSSQGGRMPGRPTIDSMTD